MLKTIVLHNIFVETIQIFGVFIYSFIQNRKKLKHLFS